MCLFVCCMIWSSRNYYNYFKDNNPVVDDGVEEDGNDKTTVAGARTPRLLLPLLPSCPCIVFWKVINLEIPIPSMIGVARNSGTGQAPISADAEAEDAVVGSVLSLLALLILILLLSRQSCQTSSVFGLLLLLLLTGTRLPPHFGLQRTSERENHSSLWHRGEILHHPGACYITLGPKFVIRTKYYDVLEGTSRNSVSINISPRGNSLIT